MERLYSIGELARRTGLTVKTIRFYSDRGILPPTDRGPTGYRRYDAGAVARLDLIRTLRDLGVDLPTIKRVLDRETTLPEVAAAHADALAVQIKVLHLRRAVLTAVARRGATPEETELMHKLAKLSEHERRRLVADFLDTTFGGLRGEPGFDGIIRSLTPELPENATAEQVEAWVELAELAQDPAFQASLRRMAERHTPGLHRDPAALVRESAASAVAGGTSPTSAEAGSVVREVVAGYPGTDLLSRLEAANDPRRDRYMELLAVINGWPAQERLAPALSWFIEALRARTGPGR